MTATVTATTFDTATTTDQVTVATAGRGATASLRAPSPHSPRSPSPPSPTPPACRSSTRTTRRSRSPGSPNSRCSSRSSTSQSPPEWPASQAPTVHVRAHHRRPHCTVGRPRLPDRRRSPRRRRPRAHPRRRRRHRHPDTRLTPRSLTASSPNRPRPPQRPLLANNGDGAAPRSQNPAPARANVRAARFVLAEQRASECFVLPECHVPDFPDETLARQQTLEPTGRSDTPLATET